MWHGVNYYRSRSGCHFSDLFAVVHANHHKPAAHPIHQREATEDG